MIRSRDASKAHVRQLTTLPTAPVPGTLKSAGLSLVRTVKLKADPDPLVILQMQASLPESFQDGHR